MAYLTIGEAKDAFRRRGFAKSAVGVLNEAAAAFKSWKRYDVFLSHCVKDAEVILGVKALLEDAGLSVYVDWVEDKDLDRGRVTPQTAAILRERMRASESMIFATSEASPNSKWMPWELGYFDGLRQERIAILPLVGSSSDTFTGQEYIGLYPTVERLAQQGGRSGIYITKRVPRQYMGLKDFTAGSRTFTPF